jgi:DNA invertase Pin-like site-specific DNA recombinase
LGYAGGMPETPSDTGQDELRASLDAVVDAAETNAKVSRLIVRKARAVARQLAGGRPHREAIEAGGRPLLVELLRGNLDRLYRSGSRLRRAEATALRDEGMTTQQIARLLGVSRQRVSRLLREARGAAR